MNDNSLSLSVDKDAAASAFSHSVAGNYAATQLRRRILEVNPCSFTGCAIQGVLRYSAAPHAHLAALTKNARPACFGQSVNGIGLDRAASDLDLAIDQIQRAPACSRVGRLDGVAGNHRLLHTNRRMEAQQSSTHVAGLISRKDAFLKSKRGPSCRNCPRAAVGADLDATQIDRSILDPNNRLSSGANQRDSTSAKARCTEHNTRFL